MLPKLADWASVVGLVVGIAALVYSAKAFVEAKRAKKSAEEARKAVRTLVAADKVHYLGSKAKELYSNVSHENYAVAVFLATDLRFEINGAITRWEFLDTLTKRAIPKRKSAGDAGFAVHAIQGAVRNTGKSESPEEV